MLTGLRYAAFFVLLYCRGVVQFLLRGYVVLAALASWKYDTLLSLLTPDGRRLILDV